MKYYMSYNFIIETPETISDEGDLFKTAAEILAANVERSDITTIANQLENWDQEREEEYV